MTELSIRGRAVIAAALSILLAVVSFGVAVDFVVERHLRHSLDSSLRRRAALLPFDAATRTPGNAYVD